MEFQQQTRYADALKIKMVCGVIMHEIFNKQNNENDDYLAVDIYGSSHNVKSTEMVFKFSTCNICNTCNTGFSA